MTRVRLVTFVVISVLALGLSACGRRGALEPGLDTAQGQEFARKREQQNNRLAGRTSRSAAASTATPAASAAPTEAVAAPAAGTRAASPQARTNAPIAPTAPSPAAAATGDPDDDPPVETQIQQETAGQTVVPFPALKADRSQTQAAQRGGGTSGAAGGQANLLGGSSGKRPPPIPRPQGPFILDPLLD